MMTELFQKRILNSFPFALTHHHYIIGIVHPKNW